MAEDEPPSDFKDILAAYDLRDVPSTTAPQGSKVQKAGKEQSNNGNDESSKSDSTPKAPDPQNFPSDGASHQPSALYNYMGKESDFRLLPNGSSSDIIASPKQWKTTEKELDLYQIAHNPMPAYVPGIPPHARASMNVPPKGIKCIECDDTFLFEHNLVEHLQRRSVLINFNCDSCKKPLIYYNRCTLKNHIRTHHERNEPADVNNAAVIPLPTNDLMNGINSFTLPFMHTALIQQLQLQQPLMISSQIPNLQNSKSSPKIKSSNGRMSSGHQSLLSSKFKISCSECCQTYENALSLEEHFGCSQNLPLGSSQCSKCHMTCASKCSLSAHERIHGDAKPYACPECGTIINNKEAFICHINVKCMHHNRVIGYKCATCYDLNSDPIKMRRHIIAEHTEAYHKCQACPMAFKADHSLDSHKKTAHLTMDVESRTIYKCPLCDTVFEGDNNLNEHLDAHIREQIQNIKFVFKCLTCQEREKREELFMTKSALKDHIRNTHPDSFKIPCSSCDAIFDLPEDFEKHLLEKHSHESEPSATKITASPGQNGNAGENSYSISPFNNHGPQSAYVCSNCGDKFHNQNGYLTHKKTCGSSPLQCKICQLTFEKKEDMIKDGRRHLSEGVLLCLLCLNYAQFENKKALFKHVEVHVSSETLFKCDLCSSKSSDSKEFLKHLRSEHGFNPVKCDMCDAEFYGTARMQRHKSSIHHKPVKTFFTCPLCNDNSFTTQGFLDKHLIISHDKSLEEIAELRNYSPIQSQLPSTARVTSPKIKTTASSDDECAPVSPLPPKNYDSHGDNGTNADSDDSSGSPPSKKKAADISENQTNALLTCSKCQFVSDDRSVFNVHIAAHKTDPLAYQCCECGSCFRAASTLRKHMFLEHGIKEYHTYTSEMGRNVITNFEDLASKNGDSLHCDVCCQSFENETCLKNHMRNHGMAFVKSHSMSLESSENDGERSN